MSYEQLLNYQAGHDTDGAAFASSTTLTDISPNPQLGLSAGYGLKGLTLRLRASGIFSTTGTPTLKLGFYWGGVAGVSLGVSPATTTGSGAASWPWLMEWWGTIRSIGSSGQTMGMGFILLGTSLSAFAAAVPLVPTSGSANAVSTTNTTVAQNVTVGAQWGTSSASNTITLQNYTVEDLTRV
jgi:hypothetical protein